ncbi:MAG TPA: M48 family metalloprotease [Pseudonocardiaceae bacterium]
MTERLPLPTQHLEVPLGPPPPREPTVRRGVGGSALGGLIVGLPWFLVSFALVSQLASFAGRGWATVILAVWLLSGGGVFVRPVENAVARFLLRVRPPTPDERHRLDGPWTSVLHAAGVAPDAYTLWVQDSRELNAYASAGHIVIVTRAALHGLPSHQVAAVLAHELGHHLRGETWIGLLVYWYSLPGRIAIRAASVVLSALLRLLGRMRFSSTVGIVVGAVLGAVVLVLVLIVAPAMVVLFLLTPLAAYFGRQDELRADRIADRLGFGPILLDVLRSWARAAPRGPARPTLRDRLIATHPPLQRRIRALETRIASSR